MTEERFNALLNGPLAHPFPMFTITRLTLALAAVVEAAGEKGEKALEDFCAARDARDNAVDREEEVDADAEPLY